MLRTFSTTLLFLTCSVWANLAAQQGDFLFTYFDTQIVDNQCFGTFSVANEVVGDLYLMERSKDGETFEQVGDWIENPMANEVNMYECLDLSPFQGISYYRIRRIALTQNSYDFSTTIQVINMPKEKELIIRPNPFHEDFIIEFTSQPYPHSTIQVVNSLGQIVFNTYIPDQTISMPISLKMQPPGLYYVWVIQNGRRRLMETIINIAD